MARLPRAGGFTMIELVAVILLLGILSIVVLPRFGNANLADVAFHDEVVSALRFAQKTAVSHRRLVCATVTATTVSLAIANANPATACDTTLTSPDGTAPQFFANSRDAAAASVTSLMTNGNAVALPAIIFFQPAGTVTAAAAGGNGDDFILAVSGLGNVTVAGATGYVR